MNPSAVPAALSHRIAVARPTLILGLVALHYLKFPDIATSPFWGMDPATPHRVASYVVSFVLFFFFSAVPLLSAISGWLFFRVPDGRLGRRIGRRIATLAPPFVLWNALALGAFLMLWRLDPATALLETANVDFAGIGPVAAADALLGIARRPVAFQFWFVRDLIVTLAVTPLLALGLRRAPLALLGALTGLWLAEFTFWGLFLRLDVTVFFVLGAVIRLRGLPLEVPGRVAAAAMAFYLALVGLRTLAPLAFDAGIPADEALVDTATRLMRLVGVVACWGAIAWLADSRAGGMLARHSGFAFFLFAFHFPAIQAVKLALWQVLPHDSDGWRLAQYGLTVTVTVVAGLALGHALRRFAPGTFRLLTGGRDQ